MEENTNPAESASATAQACLTKVFTGILLADGVSMECAEDRCISSAHELMARAFGAALEILDEKLCADLPDGVRVHDRRKRTLATKMGDVAFRCRRCRDASGCSVIPLADALDAPWGARISPAAASFLVEAGADVSFSGSARLLESAGGSKASAASVMCRMHGVGELCADEDALAAEELYGNGVLPDSERSASEICLESDGTWFNLQGVAEGGSDRIEVKALVAYAGKTEKGKKVLRALPVRHGCVGMPRAFWTEGVAAVGTRFDLSKVETCHMGCDGEGPCKAGGSCLSGIECDTRLDSFHVNRYVIGCFKAQDRKLASNILGCAMDGDVGAAAKMIDIAGENGIANKGYERVSAYLRNNAGIVFTGGPSLGTMEAEQQHVYGCRMDSVPCGWSVAGADAMARVRSRLASKRALPKPTREQSVTPRRRKRTEFRTLSAFEKKVDTRTPTKVGRGVGGRALREPRGDVGGSTLCCWG